MGKWTRGNAREIEKNDRLRKEGKEKMESVEERQTDRQSDNKISIVGGCVSGSERLRNPRNY